LQLGLRVGGNSKNQKGAITFAAHFHNANVLLSNSTFLIFAVLVV